MSSSKRSRTLTDSSSGPGPPAKQTASGAGRRSRGGGRAVDESRSYKDNRRHYYRDNDAPTSSNYGGGGDAAGYGSGRRGGGSSSSSRSSRYAASFSNAANSSFSSVEFHADLLYKNDEDRQALENMNEFEREAELARRYEELVRERQRAELLRKQDHRVVREDRAASGRLGEALSDIRARRARQKQQQRLTSEEEGEEEEEGADEDASSRPLASAASAVGVAEASAGAENRAHAHTEGFPESASFNGEEETHPAGSASAASDQPLPAAASLVGSNTCRTPVLSSEAAVAEIAALVVGTAAATESAGAVLPLSAAPTAGAKAAVSSRGGEEEGVVCVDDLFEEERMDSDDQQKKEMSRRMLQRVSLDILNAVRLSTEKLLLMLEHPQAERFVRGCYVKVLQQQQTVPNNPNTPPSTLATGGVGPCWVCQIVGLKPCETYCVRLCATAASVSCSFKLLLRLAPKAPARFDREFHLTDLVNSPITASEFEQWKRKLQEFDTIDDISKKIKLKVQRLKEFTLTDEDVQTILARKQLAAASSGVVTTSGSLLKELMLIRHQVDTLHFSLSNAATAAAVRKQLKQQLDVLLQQKAQVEARLQRSKAAAGRQRELLEFSLENSRFSARRKQAAALLLTKSALLQQTTSVHRTGDKTLNCQKTSIHTNSYTNSSMRDCLDSSNSSGGNNTLAGLKTNVSTAAALRAGVGSVGELRQRQPKESLIDEIGVGMLSEDISTGSTADFHSSKAATTTAAAAAFGALAPHSLMTSTWNSTASLFSVAAAAVKDSNRGTISAFSPSKNNGMNSTLQEDGGGIRNLDFNACSTTAAAQAENSSAFATAAAARPEGEAIRLLLYGSCDQQRAFVDAAVQLHRAASSFGLDRSLIPPPPPYASIVSLLPPSVPPGAHSLLISLEEYKQQVAQLASLQLAG